MKDVKYVCVIIDDFTPLALSFPNVQVVDFGATTEIAYYDSYYKNYWSSFSFQDKGDIDGSFLISESLGYGLVDQYFSPILVDTRTIGPDLRDYSSYYGLYMYEGYQDYYVYRSNLAVAPSQDNVGHGDWVLESFFQNLKDPESVEVVAIDVDFTTFQDFQYLFSRPQQLGGYSVLEYCVDLAFNQFFDTTNDYLLAGLSASWGSSQVNENIISVVDDLLSYGSFVFQSVANVTQSSIPWGAIEQNVINVGAYNVDRNGYILASDKTGYSYIDILANGYVEKPGWGSGWNFGTSFATPRVFASAINFFDERLSPLILTGDIDPIPIGESPPVTDTEMVGIVEGLRDEISTQINVRFADLTLPVNVRVLSDDIDKNINPAQVPVNLSDSGLKFLSATLPDTAAPLISVFNPTDGATGISVGSNITVTFSETIQRGSGNIEIRLGSATGALVEGFDAASSGRLSLSGSTLTIDPTANLTNNTSYFVTFAAGSVKDLANNNYAGTTTYDFKTVADTTAPTVSTFAPVDGATGVAVDSNIVLTFSEAVQKGAGKIEIRLGSANGTLVESFDAATNTRLVFSGSTLTIDPAANLANNTSYFVTFAAGSVKDLANNNYGGTATYDFKTVAETTPPTVLTFAPVDGATGAAVDSNIVLTFSEAVQKGTGKIELRSGSATGTLVESFDAATSARLAFSGSTLTIDPTAKLANNASYFVTFAAGSVKDLADNNYAGTTTYDFVTALPTPTSGKDNLTGTTGNDSINALAGNDTIDGGEGNDTLTGGTGVDTFNITAGTDRVMDLGAGGADVLSVSSGAAVNATVTAAWTATSATANSGTANLISAGFVVNLSAVTSGSKGFSVVNTGKAASFTGSSFADSLTGGTGNDTLVGGGGTDTLVGGAGNDVMTGGTEADSFVLLGSDTVVDFNSTDSDTLITTSLIAGAIVTFTSVTGSVDLSSSTTTAAFRATASASGASIVGGSGDDTFSGRTGTDSLSGGSGNDRISASGGADTVIGGRGIDNLSGGTGSDTFVFSAGDTGQATGSDTVSDFAKGAVNTGDRIDYSADLVIGGSLGAATTSEALINQSTGIATFAKKSGNNLADALADIATRFTAAGDAAGEIALFRVAGRGNHYLFISDGTAGVTVNDVVVQLVDLTGVASIDLSGGNLTITG